MMLTPAILMTLNPAVIALIATSFLLFLAYLCEREVLYQMYTRDYHHVKLLRIGRKLRYPAMLLSGVFAALCLMQTPTVSMLALQLAAIYCVMREGNMLFEYRDYEKAYLRGMLPAMLVTLPLLNQMPAPLGGLPLYSSAIAAVGLLACCLVNRLHVEQDLCALSD